MKVLFVFPNILKYENISVGIGHLSSYLKAFGHQTDLLDFTYGLSEKKVLRRIKEFDPGLIGFSVTTGDFQFCCGLAGRIKKVTRTPIVFGGVHPTIEPEETIRQPAVDMICVGEGEEALLEMVSRMEQGEQLRDVRNFYIKEGDRIFRNEVRPLIQDLDRLPPVDLELFHYERLLPLRAYEGQVMVGRGCPYQCTYCVNPILQKLYRGGGRFVRYRSVENVMKELHDLVGRYRIKSLYFCDDVLVLNRNWLEAFCARYRQEIGLPFRCQIRPEMISEPICALLRNTGCSSLQMGIEAGDEYIRNEVLKRRHSNEKILEAIRMARQADMTVYVYNMVGLPFETDKEILRTIDLNRRAKPDFMQTAIFQPYPGTELKAICEREGWLREDVNQIRSNKFSSIVEYPSLSRKAIRRYKSRFRYMVYKDEDLVKALICLFFDSNYRLLTTLRAKVPQRVRAWVNQMIYRFSMSR